MRRTRGANHDIHSGEFMLPVLETNGPTVQFFSQGCGTVEGTIGDEDTLSATTPKRPGGLFAGVASPDHHHLAPI